MIMRLILVNLSLFIAFAGPNHNCEFPDDCLTHDTSRTDLPCERKSDRWQRYQDATPAEREQMRARWREPMRDRIIRIYDVDASQEKLIRGEIDAIYAGHLSKMGAIFKEGKRLDEGISDYVAAFNKRDASKVPKLVVLRRVQDDPKYQDLLERKHKVEASCQIDWDDALKRIEKLLPEAQVQKGRSRLAVELPHRCCSLWIDDVTVDDNHERGDLESAHPWEAYLRRFIERYRLDGGQIGAARSVLREVRLRAVQVDRRRFKELSAVYSRGDTAALQARVEEFERRTDDLFDELNMRLDALLTTSQRQGLGTVQQDSTMPPERP